MLARMLGDGSRCSFQEVATTGHADANVNHLTSVEKVDPLGGQVSYTGIPVEVEAA